MDLNINFETLQQQCRICLQKGDINIWNCKVETKPESDMEQNFFNIDVSTEKSVMEIMNIFSNNQDLFHFSEEFPLLCWQCLENLKFCYFFYEKIRLANEQIKNIYQDTLNQCVEEHLIEVLEEKDVPETNEIIQSNVIEILEEEEEIISNIPYYGEHEAKHLHFSKKTNQSKQITPDKNDAFIITQFIPTIIEPIKRCSAQQTKETDEDYQPPQHLRTVNLKAVEVCDLENLKRPETPQSLNGDFAESAVYVCQYCPQAFAKSDYLKTHIQKSHVCKFCTQSFSVTEALFKHIREVHTEHKCVICHKMLSSQTNLRHHIKRVHRIKLPAKVTLIDFIKSTSLEENTLENEEDIFQEELAASDIDFNSQYLWENDECIEMFTEDCAGI